MSAKKATSAAKNTPAAASGRSKPAPPAKATAAKATAAKHGAAKAPALQANTKKPAVPASPAKRKQTTTKPTIKKPVVVQPPPKVAEPASVDGVYYIVAARDDLRISKRKPTAGDHVGAADNFDDAKDKAVDYLIDLIDNLERRLWEIKQSTDCDE